jgi:DNA polymerase (family 10)
MYEKHILIFKKLSSIYEKLGDEIRANAYHILSKRLELMDLEGISDKSRKKIEEITERGKLKLLDDLEKDKKIKERIKLGNIIGVGPKQAEKLVNEGITNFLEFKKLKNHTKIQKIGIKYYNKLSLPPPKVFKKIKNIILKDIDNIIKFEIAGSYRTGNNIPGDIDIIICTKTGILKPILDLLIDKEILQDYIKSGENDILGIIKLYDHYYRIDIKCTIPKYFYSYLLYFGSGKYFSKYIRGEAKSKGYKLNQYGITDLETNDLKTFRSEKSIFKYLDIPYYTPKERIKYF